MFPVLPDPNDGNVQQGTPDALTTVYLDRTLNLGTASAINASGSQIDLANVAGINIGDLIILSNVHGSAIGMVTNVLTASNSLVFGNSDPLNINQPNAASGNIAALQDPGPGNKYPPTTAARILVISYYLQQSAGPDGTFGNDDDNWQLMRQVNGQQPVPVMDGVENLQVTYDVYDDTANNSSSTLITNSKTANGTPGLIRKSKCRAERAFNTQDGANEIFQSSYFGRSRKSAKLEFPRPVQVSSSQSGASMVMSGKTREKGFALIGVLLFLVLLSAMAITLSYTVRTEKRIGGSDQEGNLAYYDAEAGMEKMTADLGALYEKTKSPSAATISALGNDKPVLPDVGYNYIFNVQANADGSPKSRVQTISAGDFAGLSAQIIPINLDVTATRVSGAQAHMTRDVEVAQIPVFQFGVFSDSDLSYFAGPNFDFGGRVHTNGDLYLAEGNGSTLTFHDKLTAHGEVIRQTLVNGLTTSGNYTGTVNVPTAPNGCSTPTNSCRPLGVNGRQPDWRQGQLTHPGMGHIYAEHVLRQPGTPCRAIDSAICQ